MMLNKFLKNIKIIKGNLNLYKFNKYSLDLSNLEYISKDLNLNIFKKDLNLSNLKYVGGNLNLEKINKELNLSKLKRVKESLYLTKYNTEELNLSNLEYIGGNLILEEYDQPNLDLSKLKYVGLTLSLYNYNSYGLILNNLTYIGESFMLYEYSIYELNLENLKVVEDTIDFPKYNGYGLNLSNLIKVEYLNLCSYNQKELDLKNLINCNHFDLRSYKYADLKINKLLDINTILKGYSISDGNHLSKEVRNYLITKKNEFENNSINETKKTKKVKKPKKPYNLNIVEKEYTVITNTNKIKKYTIIKNRQDETYLFNYNNMEFVTQKNNIDELLKIINEILKYDFELNEIASDNITLVFRRDNITYENEEYYNSIIFRLSPDRIIFNNNDIIRVNGIDIEEKMKDYFDFSKRIFTDKQLIAYLKPKYKIQEKNDIYTIKKDIFTYNFSLEKEKTDDNIKFMFKLDNNIFYYFYNKLFELNYNVNDIVLKDYNKGHFIYFDILQGVEKNVIDYKMNFLIEENIRFLNTLIDNMIKDDNLFHELKDYLPQDIINKYLERIDNNDSLI